MGGAILLITLVYLIILDTYGTTTCENCRKKFLPNWYKAIPITIVYMTILYILLEYFQ
jgi:hypothetical protein